MAEATTDPVRLPPGPRVPKALFGLAFVTARHRAVAAVGRHYGGAFTIDHAGVLMAALCESQGDAAHVRLDPHPRQRDTGASRPPDTRAGP